SSLLAAESSALEGSAAGADAATGELHREASRISQPQHQRHHHAAGPQALSGQQAGGAVPAALGDRDAVPASEADAELGVFALQIGAGRQKGAAVASDRLQLAPRHHRPRCTRPSHDNRANQLHRRSSLAAVLSDGAGAGDDAANANANAAAAADAAAAAAVAGASSARPLRAATIETTGQKLPAAELHQTRSEKKGGVKLNAIRTQRGISIGRLHSRWRSLAALGMTACSFPAVVLCAPA